MGNVNFFFEIVCILWFDDFLKDISINMINIVDNSLIVYQLSLMTSSLLSKSRSLRYLSNSSSFTLLSNLFFCNWISYYDDLILALFWTISIVAYWYSFKSVNVPFLLSNCSRKCCLASLLAFPFLKPIIGMTTLKTFCFILLLLIVSLSYSIDFLLFETVAPE